MMDKNRIFIISVLALSACAMTPRNEPADTAFQHVARAANECTTDLLAQVRHLDGKYRVMTRYYIKNQTIDTTGGKVIDTQVREIPAINADALDKGETGSAWRDCMMQRNALAPEIVMSQS
ncbi:hypothetical protein [Dickeya fangzhongdai]|uniref:hypothetical protein n=1 Tax=Dickeya fangzhongdai TaxID=1778540 RepID=UPI000675C36C|nr:hypothetical protein [Dickeya fangzhongdai]MBO8134855.1 hypothetical protein [Dickeya fangzhongdai]WES87956.1 hypothetical protein PQ617_17240 [Dickeya fangzhongdai]